MPDHLTNDVPTDTFAAVPTAVPTTAIPTTAVPTAVPPAIPDQRGEGWAPPPAGRQSGARHAGYGWPEPVVEAPRRRRRWPWIVAAVLAVLVAIAVANGRGTSSPATQPLAAPASSAQQAPSQQIPSPQVAAPQATVPAAPAAPAAPPAPAAPVAPVAPAGPASTMEDGTYEVGTDVAPGRYKTAGPAGSSDLDMCYWERARNDSGEFSSIIANAIVKGPGSVTVKKGEFVKLSGGCSWTKQ